MNDPHSIIPPIDPFTGKPVIPTDATIKRVDDDEDLAETNVDREVEIEKEGRDPDGLLHDNDNRDIDTASTAAESGEEDPEEEDPEDLIGESDLE